MEANQNKSGGKRILFYVLVGMTVTVAAIVLLIAALQFFVIHSAQPPQTPTAQVGDAVAQELAKIDNALRETLSTSVAYLAPPAAMSLDQTVTVELLLNPAVEPSTPEGQVNEPGQVVTSTIEVTPRTKAELFSQDGEAFVIQPLHDSPEQFISPTEATRWDWDVTAKKGGRQRLTLVIYRLVTVDGKENWRQVEVYRSEVQVRISLLQRMAQEWKWIAGFVVLSVLFVFWRGPWKRSGHKPAAAKRTGAASQNPGRIFISYRRSDSADIAGRIYDRLVDEFGRGPIFKDVDSIPLGIDFKEYLDKKVSECSVFLAIIGDRWFDARDEAGKRRLDDPADFVRIEIESALGMGIPVIPLLVRGANMPFEKDLPPGLKKLVYKNGIPIRPDPDFHRDMDRLIAALNQYME